MQPHREGPARGGDLGQVLLDGRQRRGFHLGRRQQGDMGGDAVGGGVAEARAPLLEQAAVRLRDRDRNAERYGPHAFSLLALPGWCAGARRRCAPRAAFAARFRCALARGSEDCPGETRSRRHRPTAAHPAALSASRAGSPPCRRPAPGSRRRRPEPSPRPWPGSSPASPGRPGTRWVRSRNGVTNSTRTSARSVLSAP